MNEKPIVLIACCGQKLTHAAPARQLYTSPLFTKSVAWAEAKGLQWAVLSAEHGVVEPDDVIEPYNVTLNTMSAEARRHWASRTAFQIRLMLGHGPFIVLAGKHYREAVREFAHIAPMSGLGIGEQLAWLTAQQPVATVAA